MWMSAPLTQVEALPGSEPSLPVLPWPVLSTAPVPGCCPAVSAVLGQVLSTVQLLPAWVVLAATVTPFVPPQFMTLFLFSHVLRHLPSFPTRRSSDLASVGSVSSSF